MIPEREQFETWYRRDAKQRIGWYTDENVDSDLVLNVDGFYMRTSTRRLWEMWQAVRAEQRIVVPDDLIQRLPEILRTGKASRWEIQALINACSTINPEK